MNGRVPTSPMCTIAEDGAGRVGILPACAARASQAAWVAPAEPPASGEAQCADGDGDGDGEVGRKGAAQHAVVLSQGERA